MWHLRGRDNKIKRWSEYGDFHNIADAASRILELEGDPNGALFFRISTREANPSAAQAIEARARTWLAEHGAAFPGDTATGILGASAEDEESFDNFANDAPCPALDLSTGLCAVYAWRPMTCRVFGPPIKTEDENGAEGLGHCELCFTTATPAEVAACEMPVPHALEAELVSELGSQEETIVAFALLP